MKKVEDLKIIIKKFIVKSLQDFNEIVSVSIPGSFEKKSDISIISDIDIVIIVKELNENLFEDIVKRFQIKGEEIFLDNYNIVVNSTFGPLKFNDKNTLIFHLMIYDLKGHRDHVINSPFTCYDWEKSKPLIGKSLSEVYTSLPIQLNDLVSSRRSLTNYIDDINKEHISYRKYVFNDNKVSVKKFQFEMNDKMRMEYNFHVVKFILLNMMKIINQENLDYSELEIIKNFSLEGYEKRKIINILNKLYLWKYHKSDNPKNLLKPIKKELFDLNDKYLKFVENLPLINFIRHKKTKYNDGSFLGIGRDPDIMDNMKFDDEKYNLIFSSEMKRAFSTAKLLNCKKILINDLLNEIDYGKAEGMTYVDLKISYPEIIEQWNLKNDPKFPNGENSRDVIFRLEKFLEKNIYSINLKKVAVVTHNVVVRMLLSKFYQIDLNLSCKLTIDNCEKIPFRVYGNNIIPQLNHDQRIKFRDQFTYE